MKKKGLIARIGILSCLTIGLLTQGYDTNMVYATETELQEVDMSRGVTYDVDGNSFINLNGNSVIIEDVAVSEGTTQYRKFYIDENRNGIIDEGETAADVGYYFGGVDNTEVPVSIPVYGVYKAKSTTPIRITANGNSYSELVAVEKGEVIAATDKLKSEQEPAVYVDCSATSVSTFFGVRTGKVSSVKVDISSICNIFFGVYSSEVVTNGTEATAVDINVDGATIESFNCVNMSTVSANGTVKNAVQVQMDGNLKKSAYVISDSTINTSGNVEKAVEVESRGNVSGSIEAVKNSTINLGPNTAMGVDYDLAAGSSSAVYAVYESDILSENESATAIDVTVSGSGKIIGALYVAKSSSSSSSAEKQQIQGDINLNIDYKVEGNETQTPVSFDAATFLLDGAIVVDGNVETNIKNATVSYFQSTTYSNNDVYIDGDMSCVMDDTSAIGTLNGLSGTTIKGNLTYNINGRSQSSNSYISGYFIQGYASGYDYAVGGNFSVTCNKGNLSSFALVNSTYIKGDVSFTMPKGSLNGFTGLQNSKAGGDVTFKFGTAPTKTEDGTSTATTEFESKGQIQGFSGGGQILGSYTVEVYNCGTYGYNFDLFSGSSSQVVGDVVCKIDGGAYSWINNNSTGSNVGSYSFDIRNATISSGTYGLHGLRVAGDVNVTMKHVKAGSYETYAINNYYNSMNWPIEGDVVIDIDDYTVSSTFYGIYGGSYAKDVQMNLNDITCTYFYGLTSGANAANNVTVNTSGISTSNPYNYSYGISNGVVIQGKLDYNIGKEMVKNDTESIVSDSYSNFYVLYNNVTVVGTADIDVLEGSFGSFYLTDMNVTCPNIDLNVQGGNYTNLVNFTQGVSKGEVNVTYSGAKFGTQGGTFNLTNNLNGTVSFNADLSDCQMLATPNITINGVTTATGFMKLNSDYYYIGGHDLTSNVSANNVYTANGTEIRIPEGITMEAKEKFYLKNGTGILLEGAIKGDFYNEPDNEYSDYTHTNFYVNGGTLDTATKGYGHIYYPMSISYWEKGGSIYTLGVSTHSKCPGQLFGLAGEDVSVTCTPKKGYKFVSATVQKESSDEPVAMAPDENVAMRYSFAMTEEEAEVVITYEGKQIILGKTVADPVAKLNVATTADAPLYDVSDVTISNDGEEGTVSYALDTTYGLPEGLVFENGKIYGKPTKAYESGKKTVIKVTGKNGSIANLSLNVVVTAGNAEQPNQEGRILVNETDKTISLLGSSVVIQTTDNATGIYIDDNRDGAADNSVAVYEGDLAEYTIYGLEDLTWKKPVAITMKSGRVKAIYGVVDSNLTVSGVDAVKVNILGGEVVEKAVAADGSVITGTVWLSVAKNDATCGNCTAYANDATASGYFVNDSGEARIGGVYSLKDDAGADSLEMDANTQCTIENGVTISIPEIYTSAGSSFVVEKGASLTADTSLSIAATATLSGEVQTKHFNPIANSIVTLDGTLTCEKASITKGTVYNKGSFSCTGTFSNTGKLVLQGGTVAQTDNEWANVYYPVSFETNLDGTTVSLSSNYERILEDGVYRYYANGGTTVGASTSNVSGYRCYYSINDGERQTSESNSFSFAMPRKSSVLKVTYVPRDITVTKQFADPIGVVGKEYTTSKPLFDVANLTISNDTTTQYGGDVRYQLKSSSSLPKGISYKDGKLIGTPTATNGDGQKVTITVTGRNGTTCDVSIIIKIVDAASAPVAINDVMSYSSSSGLNLKGYSVVIQKAVTDSNKCSVYLDMNQDGIADSADALVYNGSTAIDLSGAKIYGYKGVSGQSYKGNVTITLLGGKVGYIYGCYGTSSVPAVVDGDVTVNVKGGTISYGVYAGYYATADNLNLHCTGGTITGEAFAAYYPMNAENVSLIFTDSAYLKMKSKGDYSSSKSHLSAVRYGTVDKDVNITIGTNLSNVGIDSYNATFYACYGESRKEAKILGDVNCTIVGDVGDIDASVIAYYTNVTGDINIDWQDGFIKFYNSVVKVIASDSTADEIILTTADNENISGWIDFLWASEVRNIKCHISDKADWATIRMVNSNAYGDITNCAYIYNQGSVDIDGTYTFEEDIEIPDSLSIGVEEKVETSDDAKVTIAEGVTVTVGGETTIGCPFINNGDLTISGKTIISNPMENHGNLKLAGATTASAAIKNDGYMKNTGSVTTSNKITNNGTWDCSYQTIINSPGGIENNGTLNLNAFSYKDVNILSLKSGTQLINNKDAILTLKHRIGNSGSIVNYGTLQQPTSYQNYGVLGKIYTTTMPKYYGSATSYSDTYYAVSVDYLEGSLSEKPVFTDANGNALASSGVAGDTNQYVQAGKTFNMSVVTPNEGYTIGTVTFGENGSMSHDETKQNWTGKFGYEPTVVSINYEGVTNIELESTTDTVEGLQVDVYNNKIYDLNTIKIKEGTDATEGTVTYTVANSTPLPAGLSLSSSGIIYGTPKKASGEAQDIKIYVKGKNKTSATFTLTIDAIAKGIPTAPTPSYLYANVGDLLSSIALPTPSNGTYTWVDGSASVGEVGGIISDFDVYFTPNAEANANYDWSKVKNGTYADGKVTVKAKVSISKISPTYPSLSGLEATYGQTLADITLPSDEAGSFVWALDSSTSVGAVGTRTFYVNYVPTNTDKYIKVNNIKVTVTVKAKTAETVTFEPISSLQATYGSTLADIELPDVEGGRYQWVTQPTTVVEDGKTYRLGYKPNDISNYDWTSVEGYDSAYEAVIFDVVVHVIVEDYTITKLPTTITVEYGKKLSDTALPYVKNGKWYLSGKEITNSSVSAEGIPNGAFKWAEGNKVVNVLNSMETKVGFYPEASVFDSVENIKVTVKVAHSHAYGSWKSDASNHWKECTCGSVSSKAAHTWDAGKVTKEATATTDGTKLYTCTACKKTKTESIPATGDNSAEGPTTPTAGTVLEDNDADAEYKVTSSTEGQAEVSYKVTNANVTTIKIPDTIAVNGITYRVTTIEDNAFKNHKKLKKIVIGANIKAIGKNAFYGCKKLTSVTIGKNVVTIGDGAFQNCTALTKITIPTKVTKIGNKSFYGCKKLATVKMGKNVTTIGNSAFQNCTALKKIEIPSKVKKIGSKAFYGCKKLTSITIKTTKLTTKNVGKQAFTKAGSSNYKKLTVKVPKKKKSAYKTMLKKRGLNSKAKVK